MKTYIFEGKEYIENGEVRPPKYGEVFYWENVDLATRANFDFISHRIILIPKEEKKMNEYPKEQIEALDKSINEKWMKIVNGEKEDDGLRDCPLCSINEFAGTSCNGCIIKGETGEACCRGINHHIFIEHIEKKHKSYMGSTFDGYRVYCTECKNLAMKVLDNLKKIRENVCIKEEKKYFVKMTKNGVPFREGGFYYIYIDDEYGNLISMIAELDKDGIRLKKNIEEYVGLSLDKEGRILVRKD